MNVKIMINLNITIYLSFKRKLTGFVQQVWIHSGEKPGFFCRNPMCEHIEMRVYRQNKKIFIISTYYIYKKFITFAAPNVGNNISRSGAVGSSSGS